MRNKQKHYLYLLSKDQTYLYIFIRFFSFSYDSVDQIILAHPSFEIKGNKINLEKTPTGIQYR